MLYRRRRPSLALLLPALGAISSGSLWLAMHFYSATTAASDVVRLVLCFGSILFELLISVVVAYLDQPSPPRIHLLAERQALMTLIVLGEGLIGLLSTFSTIVSGIGFERESCALASILPLPHR